MDKNPRANNRILLILLSAWAPVLVWAIVIFSFSALPTSPVAEIHWQDFIIKKSAHIIEYGVFAILLYRAFIMSNLKKKKAILYAFLIAVLYGVTDEYHQSYTPGRDPKVRDIFFDSFGALMSLYFINKILPRSPYGVKLLAERFKLI